MKQTVSDNFYLNSTVETAAKILGSRALVTFSSEVKGIKIEVAGDGIERITFPKLSSLITPIVKAYYMVYIDRIAGHYQAGYSLKERYGKLTEEAKRTENPDTKLKLFCKKTIGDRVAMNHMQNKYLGSAMHQEDLDTQYPVNEAISYATELNRVVKVMFDRNCKDKTTILKSIKTQELKDEIKPLIDDLIQVLEDCDPITEFDKQTNKIEARLYDILKKSQKMEEEMKKTPSENLISIGNKSDKNDSQDNRELVRINQNGVTYDPKTWNVHRFETKDLPCQHESTAIAHRIKTLLPWVYRKFHGEDKKGISSPKMAGNKLLTSRLLKYKMDRDMRIFAKRWKKKTNNCSVFFCMDMSGSMQGAPMELVLTTMRTFGYALETSNIRVGMYGFGSSFRIFKEPGEMPTCGKKFWGLNTNSLGNLGGTCGWEAVHEIIKRVELETTDRQIVFMGTDGGWCSPNTNLDRSARWWIKKINENPNTKFIPLGIGSTQNEALAYAREMASHMKLPNTKMVTAVCNNKEALVPALIKALESELED